MGQRTKYRLKVKRRKRRQKLIKERLKEQRAGAHK